MKTSPEDIWISRIVDRRADVADWREFERAAADDGELWQRLGRTLQADMALADAMNGLLDGEPEAVQTEPARPPRRRAVLLAITWLVLGLAAGVATGVAIQDDTVSPPRVETPVEAVPVLTGREPMLVRELPPEVLGTEPAADGLIEIIYMRRIVERRRVDRLFEMHRDEHGRAIAMPADPQSLRPARSL